MIPSFCRFSYATRNIFMSSLRTRPNQSKLTTLLDCKWANQKQREDLAAAYRGLEYYGLAEGVCNHLSTRSPARKGKGEVMLLVRYGLHWSEVTASSLLGINLEDGQVVEGDGKSETTAMEIHIALHKYALKSDPQIKTVFHTHPPYVTALACLKDPTLRMIHQNSIRYFDDISYDSGYGGVAATGNEEGTRIAKQMNGKHILFMGNHGVVVVGKSPACAFDNTYYIEKAAKVQVLAMSTGQELSEINTDVAIATKQLIDDNRGDVMHLDAIARIIHHTHPGDFTS